MKKECEIKDGELEFCTSLNDKLAPLANAHNKGLVQINIYNPKRKGCKQKCIGVAYKKDANDMGSMLNYCPWCGKKIQNWDKEEN